MGLTAGPDGPAARQRKLEERLEALESPRTQVTHPVTGNTVRGRATQVDGVPVWVVTEKGQEAPGITASVTDPSRSRSASSSSWVPMYLFSWPTIATDAFRARVVTFGDAPSVFEMRLESKVEGSNSILSSVRTLSDLTETLDWRWVHGQDLSASESLSISMQVRRVSGTGTALIFEPEFSALIGSDIIGATTAGT